MVRAREQVTGCKPVLIEQLPKRTAHASEIRTGDPDFSAGQHRYNWKVVLESNKQHHNSWKVEDVLKR